MQILKQLFEELYGVVPTQVEPLAKAGSNREYFRLSDATRRSVIGVVGKSIEENKCFIYLAQHFRKKSLPAPKVLITAADASRYLQEDLGARSLYDALKTGRESKNYSAEEIRLLERTMCLLPHIQIEGSKELDLQCCIEPRQFSPTAVMFDLNYFKYCFFRTLDIEYDELKLEIDFRRFAEDLCTEESKGFLYRDFQARNILLSSSDLPQIIDFQGGMLGPLQYDVASFLWQASSHYSNELRQHLINTYLDELETLIAVDRKQFVARLQRFVLLRLLQVLGAYGMRGYFERKKYFLDSIPIAIANLAEMLALGAAKDYPYLEKILSQLIAHPRFVAIEQKEKMSVSQYDGQGELVIRINSFSYKNGIPADPSGNGGGYVFDCRSTHNPGRYEAYKPLTGLDAPVIDFLEKDGEILTFLDSVYPLAEHHVERFLERGFTHVMFSFGCTGGRHRSVYSAQHLAEHLYKKYGCEILLCHREQNISQTFPRKETNKR